MRGGASLRLRWPAALVAVVAAAVTAAAAAAGHGDHNFHRDFDAVWGKGNARFRDGGRMVELTLDEQTGARLQSKERFLFGRFDLEIKLVRGESAGTITSFYVSWGSLLIDLGLICSIFPPSLCEILRIVHPVKVARIVSSRRQRNTRGIPRVDTCHSWDELYFMGQKIIRRRLSSQINKFGPRLADGMVER